MRSSTRRRRCGWASPPTRPRRPGRSPTRRQPRSEPSCSTRRVRPAARPCRGHRRCGSAADARRPRGAGPATCRSRPRGDQHPTRTPSPCCCTPRAAPDPEGRDVHAVHGRAALARTAAGPPDAVTVGYAYLPLSHLTGRAALLATLGRGGTVALATSTDLSALFEDLRVYAPTELVLVPRIAEMVRQEGAREEQRRLTPARPSRWRDRRRGRACTGAGRPPDACLRRSRRAGRVRQRPAHARAPHVPRGVPRRPAARPVRLDRGGQHPARRRGAAAAGHRAQARRRPRARLPHHRPTAPARRAARAEHRGDPRVLPPPGRHRRVFDEDGFYGPAT